MKISNLTFKISSAFWLLYWLGVAILAWSVVKSGYNFQFNADEVFNSNTIYLMVKGYKPYLDFYTVYSPIVHWVLTPVFLIFGFNFEAVSVARVVMIGLFFVRIVLIYLLVARIFSKRVGLIFLPLYLMSPFVVFSEMQIRPDNLMMLFYTAFLLSFVQKRYLLAGVLFAVTFLTNIKIAPSLGVFGLAFAYYAFRTKNFFVLMQFVNGSCLTFLAFFAYFFINGYVGEMFLHVFLDPVKLNSSIPNATWLGYFYFSNPTIYGLDGKPLNWMYTWVLPVLAFAGGYASIIENLKFKIQKEGNEEIMSLILFLSLFVQWLSMLFINSVFIQYYIPLNWLFAVFMAYFLDDLVFKRITPGLLQKVVIMMLLVIFTGLYKTSIDANIARSKITDDPIVKDAEKLWKLIPEDQPAFPNVVFRRPIYPILWGSTFAPYMRERYQSAYKVIDKYKLTVLTGLTDEYYSFLDNGTQLYIQNNYQRDSVDKGLWRKIAK